MVGSNKEPLPYIFIYGENGSGKSNLLSSFMFLKDTIYTLNHQNESDKLKEFIEKLDSKRNEPNGDIGDNMLDVSTFIRSFAHFGSLQDHAKQCQMIDAESGVGVAYHFFVNGKHGQYRLNFDINGKIIHEELRYFIESKIGQIFEIEISETTSAPIFNTSPHLFKNDEYKREFSNLVEKYWGKHTIMAILTDQMEKNNEEFMKKRLGTGILDAVMFLRGYTIECKEQNITSRTGSISNMILGSLSNGSIPSKNRYALEAFEDALNDFFTRIYSDIKRVYYQKEEKEQKIRYNLIFTKLICGKLRDVSVDAESTGTIKLLNNFPAFFECTAGSTVLIDELDSGIHDLLLINIMDELLKSFKGQFIATTHNTLLLNNIHPKNAFVIQIDSKGDKRVVSINDIDNTQKNHNNSKRYLSGLFDGIPISSSIDFEDIVENTCSSLENDK